MESRPSSSTAKPFVFLNQAGVIIHIVYALGTAVCITAAARPDSVYVALRAFIASYIWILFSTLAYAHLSRKWFWIWMIVEFFFLNQWLTWALLDRFQSIPTVLATFIAHLTWGYAVTMAVARGILPVPMEQAL
jgi:hypothetical protein